MLHWSVHSLTLDLRYTWKISRNASDQKTNLIVTVKEGNIEAKGEAAPNVRYDESPEKLLEQFETFRKQAPEQFNSSDELDEYLREHHFAHSLCFAISSAWHHLRAKTEKVSVASHLGLTDPGTVPISYTIPMMDPGVLKSFYSGNNLGSFAYLKVKIDAEEGFETLRHLATFSDQRILLDPNEAFKDVEACIYFLEKIRKYKIDFVEQPMPAGMDEEYHYLKKYSPFPLFADESVLDAADFGQLKQMFDGINVKLMKTGSYTKAISLLRQARAKGMKTMIGCMVETSLGISSGLNLSSLCDYCDLDSFLLLKDEPFGILKESEGSISFR